MRLGRARSHPCTAPLLRPVLLSPVGLLAGDESDDGDDLAEQVRRQEEHGGVERAREIRFLKTHVAKSLLACHYPARRLGKERKGETMLVYVKILQKG